MEELFAHNLHSEGKTRKDKKKHTTETKSSVCSLLWRWEQKTAKSASTWLGKLHIWVSKPLLEKYLGNLFLAVTGAKNKGKKEKHEEKWKRHVSFYTPASCLHWLHHRNIYPQEIQYRKWQNTTEEVCGTTQTVNIFWCYIYTHRTHPFGGVVVLVISAAQRGCVVVGGVS